MEKETTPCRLLLAPIAAVVIAALMPSVAHAELSRAALLDRYQPVTVTHPAELFPAVPVDAFLQSAQLEQRTLDGAWIPAIGQIPGVLPTADPSGCTSTAASACWRLNLATCSADGGIAALTCYRDLERAHVETPAVYGAVLRAGTRIVLEYWYWYWYDFWSGTFPATDYLWQAHEGDWEVVTISLTTQGTPLSVGYSEHSCGKVRAWAKVPKWRKTTHPLAYVALGSHANYFTAGPRQIDLRKQCYPELGAALLRAFLSPVLEYTGNGKAYGPALKGVARARIIRLTAQSPQWSAFPGYWGEINLFHAPNPIGTQIGGPSPRSPRYHDVWTDPLGTLQRWPRG
jgi:hypothetical protein